MSAVSRTTSLVLLLSLTLIGPSLELLAASQSRPASTDNNGISGKASVGKDSDFLKIVEAGLFNNLGLKSRPNPQRKSDIPDYMLELYDLYSSRSGSASPFLKTKGRGLTSANTVRSFLHTGECPNQFTKELHIISTSGHHPTEDDVTLTCAQRTVLQVHVTF